MDELSYRQLAEKFLAALRDRKVQFGRAASAATAGQSIQILRDGLPPIRARAQNNVSPGDACTLFVLDNGEVRAFGQHASDSSELTRTLRYRRHREEPLTQIEEQVLSLLLYEQPALTGLLLYQKTASSRLTALFTRRKKSRGQVAILYAVIERREGPHPEELCPCVSRWMPTSNGCISVCTREGEFTSQQACEAFRANPPVGATSYDYRATRLFPGTGNYTAGSFYGNLYFSGYYNLFIVRPRDGGSEIANYHESEAKWFRETPSGRQYLEWWEVDLILVGGHDRYVVSGGILNYTSRSNINYDYPLLYTYPWELGGNGATPPPIGKLFQATFFLSEINPTTGLRAKIPRYSPGQPETRAEFTLMLPAFEPHGRVNSWQVIAVPGQPPFFPFSPQSPNPTQNNSHYVAKLFFKLDREILLEEYLLPSHYNYNSATNGSNQTYSYLSPQDLEGHLVCVEEDCWEVVIKAGLFSERKSRANYYGQEFNYPRCVIDKFLIKKGEVLKTRYRFPEAVQLHPNNWAAPLLQNWYYEKYDYFQNTGGDKDGAILSRSTNSNEGIVINPAFKNRIYAEYLNRLLFLRAGNRPTQFERASNGQLIKIQGASIGYDLVNPRGIPSMGCSFFEQGQKIYAIDAGLNQWIPSRNEILIEAVKAANSDEEIPIILKAGEVEVIRSSDPVYGGVQLQNINCNLRFLNPTGIEAKVLGLQRPNAVILEVQPNWVDLNKIIQSPVPIYSNIYQNSFVEIVGEGDTLLKGIFTWAEKHPIQYVNFEPFIISYLYLNTRIPPEGLRLKNCDGEETNPLGILGAANSLAVQDFIQFNRRPRIVGKC